MKEDDNPEAESADESSSAEPLSIPEEYRLEAADSFSLAEMVRKRAFFSGFVELPKDRSHWSVVLLLMLAAYALSFIVRLDWIDFAQATYLDEDGETQFLRPNMVMDGVALPNTHDSFYFGSILQKAHLGMHQDNDFVPSAIYNGAVTYLPYLLLKIFPDLSVGRILLWGPVVVAGLVCIPLVLIGRLYGSALWGFFAACLAGVAHSYFNRTLAGYYDTDMLSITAPAFALFFLLAASRKESLGYLAAAAVSLYLNRFFYGSAQAVTCATCLAFLGYRLGLLLLEFLTADRGKDFVLWRLPSFRFTCLGVLFVGWALYAEAWSRGSMIEANVPRFWLGLLVPVIAYGLFRQGRNLAEGEGGRFARREPKENLASTTASFLLPDKALGAATCVVLALVVVGVPPFLNVGPYGGTWSKMTAKLQSYTGARAAGSSTTSGYQLNFLDVKKTIREAGSLDEASLKVNDLRMRKRILEDLPLTRADEGEIGPSEFTGWLNPFEKGFPRAGDLSIKTALLAFFGYLLLCFRYWEFCLATPFWAIAYKCFSTFTDSTLGLRFTVHVGNIAALGVAFLLLVLVWLLTRAVLAKATGGKAKATVLAGLKAGALVVSAGLVVAFVAPNVEHARAYSVHQVVYPAKTAEVLGTLETHATPDDFVVTWWDYGSGAWFFGGARSFTSPAHQTRDNYLSSEILRSPPLKAANLARRKAETFLNLAEINKRDETQYTTAAQAMLRDGRPDLVYPPRLFAELESPDYVPPTKSCDLYLYLPPEIVSIFPTIMRFSARNLLMPKQLSDYNYRDPQNLTILRGARKEGRSLVFETGHRLDSRGNLKLGRSGSPLAYREVYQVEADGEPARKVKTVDYEGLSIVAKSDSKASLRLLFLPSKGHLVLLTRDGFRSALAKRFLLDQFDEATYDHPTFATASSLKSALVPSSPYYMKVTSPSVEGTSLVLNGAVLLDSNGSVRFRRYAMPPAEYSHYSCLHDTSTGKLNVRTIRESPRASFHYVESNQPFLVPKTVRKGDGVRTVRQWAAYHGVSPQALAQLSGRKLEDVPTKEEELEIPSTYRFGNISFFMDDETFRSVLVQGFFFENLDPTLYEPVHLSAWGKIYRIKR